MAWIGPAQCEDQCCGPPTPCTPPVVTCKRYATGGTYGTGYIEYTISDADTAEIVETCPDETYAYLYSGTTETHYPITLSSGAATGVFNGVRDQCTYEVRATNECGTTICRDECVTPICSLTVFRYRPPTASLTDEYESVKVQWAYSAPPGGVGGQDEIVSAVLDGNDVFGDPFIDDGELTYANPSDLPEQIIFTVTNDCGKQTQCVFDVPCCWRVQLFTLTVSDLPATISESCTYPIPDAFTVSAGLIGYIRSASSSFELTGLDAVNGTYTAVPRKFECRVTDGDEYLAASCDITETFDLTYDSFDAPPDRTRTVLNVTLTYSVNVYITLNNIPLGIGDKVGYTLSFRRSPNVGHMVRTFTVTNLTSLIVLVNRPLDADVCVCPFGLSTVLAAAPPTTCGGAVADPCDFPGLDSIFITSTTRDFGDQGLCGRFAFGANVLIGGALATVTQEMGNCLRQVSQTDPVANQYELIDLDVFVGEYS